MNLKERTYLWYIALLRIYVGYYMLQQGIRKFQRDFPRGDWIGKQIGDLATIDLYPWYKKFLVDYVVPHQELFGYLVMFGEILVGGCLLLGLLTRLNAFIALFMLINYYLGPGMARGGAAMAQQQTFIVSLVIFLLSNPGRRAGIGRAYFSRRQGCKMKLQGSATAEGTERYRKRFEGKIVRTFSPISRTVALVHRHRHLSGQSRCGDRQTLPRCDCSRRRIGLQCHRHRHQLPLPTK